MLSGCHPEPSALLSGFGCISDLWSFIGLLEVSLEIQRGTDCKPESLDALSKDLNLIHPRVGR